MAVTIRGARETAARLALIPARAQQLQPVLEVVANLLERHVAQIFQREGPRGQPWAPLAASTVRARQRRWGYYRQAPAGGAGAAGPVLLWTGRLRGSFTRGGTAHIREIADTQLHWGSGIPYGRYVARRRPILVLDARARAELIRRPVILWLQGAAPGAIETIALARAGL